MTPEREITLSNRAKEVLENEAYQDAWVAIEKELIQQWQDAPARDLAGKESLWLQQRLLGKLRVTLEATMSAGKLAAANLRHNQTMLERAKDLLR